MRRLVVFFLLVACQPSAPLPVAAPSSRPAALGVNDVLDVRIYQEPDLSGTYDALASTGRVAFEIDMKEMTNIAAQFSLSEKTVGHHVSTILSKLNVTNRIEAATYAVRTA